jgi:hypothetical protein
MNRYVVADREAVGATTGRQGENLPNVQILIEAQIAEFQETHVAGNPGAGNAPQGVGRSVSARPNPPGKAKGRERGDKPGKGLGRDPSDNLPPGQIRRSDNGRGPDSPAGRAESLGGTSSIRVAIEVHIYEATTSFPIVSEKVVAQAPLGEGDATINVSAFRWDQGPSQAGALGSATRQLVQQAVAKIGAVLDNVAWCAWVISASDNEVYFNAGSAEGVRPGDRFRVLSVGEPLTDPITGEVLGRDQREVGEIEVVRADDKVAVGRVLNKQGAFQRLNKVAPR